MPDRERHDTTVLLVEDNPGYVRLVRELLVGAGGTQFRVEPVGTLGEGLQRLESGPADVVFLDLGLPDSQGLDTFRRLHEKDSRVPVVILTVNDDEELAIAAVHEGAQEYLAKGQVIGGQLVRAARYAIERKKAEEERLRLITAIEQAAECVVMTDPDGSIQFVNPAFERITGYSRQEAVGGNPRLVKSGKHDEAFYKRLWDTISRGEVWDGHFVNKKKDGTLYEEVATISPVRDSHGNIVNYVKVARDVTQQRKLEDQLRQAQKMEAVGRLTGGVAHDFNNMLTAIIGNTELLLLDLPTDSPLRECVHQISDAAARAASLTRQLLAFSRKAIIQPRVLNLNAVLAEMGKMLRQVIGEDITLKTTPASDLWNVKADPTNIDQIIVNLAVNARDAMPRGGKLTLETQNVILDEEYARQHPGAKPGRYVMLAVSDSGVGMDAETMSHVFEPFFTTKGKEGTGLGLATVYGIVSQHEGHLWCYSEPRIGTTFKVYLPAVDAPVEIRQAPLEEDRVTRGRETVLVVDDEAAIVAMAARMLRERGYSVIAATRGEDALRAVEKSRGPVHLLLTDVVLPGMSGRSLAGELAKTHPEMAVLFTSGYTGNVVAHHGVLDANVAFIQKPYRLEDLLRKVREVLAARKQSE